MKKKIVIITLASIAIFILPLIIDWCILGNNLPSNICNSDWASFLGAYIGALISGFISFVGIVWTIRFTREQNQKDRELQVRPYCTVKLQNTEQFTQTKKSLGYYTLGFEPKENAGPELNGMLLIQNYGVGPAIDCCVEIEPIDVAREQYPISPHNLPYGMNVGVSCIQPGDEVSFSIHIEMNFDKILPEDIVFHKDMPSPFYSLTQRASGKYKDFDINMNFIYHDILHNEYVQKITMTVNVYNSIADDGTSADYRCNLDLTNVANPVKK